MLRPYRCAARIPCYVRISNKRRCRKLQTSARPSKAMILAAGLGLRMRPLTDQMPKPLVRVAGRALLDHVLDKLANAGVAEAVINVHYLPDQIIDYVAERKRPRVIISDERDEV